MNSSIQLIDSQWASMEVGSTLLNALLTLPPQGQRAINLRFWENYTIEEISEHLRISWDEADQLIEQSLKQLRSYLTNTGLDSSVNQAS